MKILVVICTRNPRLDVLTEVLDALKFQSYTSFKTVLINNGGDELPLLPLQDKFGFDVVFESRIGNSWARYTAMSISDADLLIFVDDDNILAPNYVEEAVGLAIKYPSWGVFGGKQIRHEELSVPKKKEFLLPYLAIRELGSKILSQKADLNWVPLEPVGAGMCVKKEVVEIFLSSPNLSHYFELGRKGKRLLSGEDSFIARHAMFGGLDYGYAPSLQLVHRIKSDRISTSYLARLMFGYGLSDAKLDRALNINRSNSPKTIKATLLEFLFHCGKRKYGYLLGLRSLGQYWGSRIEYSPKPVRD